MFPFFCFQPEIFFWTNLVKKNQQNCYIKPNFGTWLSRTWRIQLWCSIVMMTGINLFGGKFGTKIQIIEVKINWSWNLAPRLTNICRIWWLYSFLVSFLERKYPFWVYLVENSKFQVTMKFLHRLFLMHKIRWWRSLFDFGPFLASFVQKVHLAFQYYLINLEAVYSQRPKASGFVSNWKIWKLWRCLNLKRLQTYLVIKK